MKAEIWSLKYNTNILPHFRRKSVEKSILFFLKNIINNCKTFISKELTLDEIVFRYLLLFQSALF